MWQFTPIAWLYGAAAAISYTLAVLAWRMRPARSALVASLLLASTGTWALGYLLGFFNTTLAWKLAMLRVEYLGIAGTAFFFALFALIYSQFDKWVNRITIALLAVVPVISYILIVTVEYHDLFYRHYDLTTQGGLVVTDKIYGPAFWVFAGYDYVIVAVGAIVLLQAMARFPSRYRGQFITLIPAALIPLACNALYLSGLNPLAPYDPSSLSFTVAGFFIAVGMGSYRLLDIVPVAHDLVVRNIKSGVIVIDGKSQILEMNPAAEGILGRSRDDALGDQISSVFPTHQELMARFESAAEVETEIALGEKTYELEISPLRDRRGAISGQVIMLHDVTLRKETEDALWASHNQMSALRRMEHELSRKLSIKYVVTLGMDAAIRLSFANAAFVALADGDEVRVVQAYGRYPNNIVNTRLSREEGVIGRAIRMRKPELVSDDIGDPDYKPSIPGMCAQMVIPLVSQDRFVGLLNLETLQPERFSPYMLETLILLAGRIAAAIDNARAYEERERLIDELDTYARTVAHGLKNPLAATIGYVELIEHVPRGQVSERLRKSLDGIIANSRKMVEIVNALLLLASVRKLEGVVMKRLDMGAVVAGAQGRLSKMIGESHAEITAPDHWPDAYGFAPWVEEVWANYISNAIKYGGSPPRVVLGAEPQDDGLVRFWVQDNGKGLAREEQAQLFIPFSRLAPDQAEGHGLGLSIVQRIVRRLGGEAGVESVVGVGSTFFFTLPVADTKG